MAELHAVRSPVADASRHARPLDDGFRLRMCRRTRRRAGSRWGEDVVPEGFMRLSAGCEALDDLLADLEHALDRSAGS